MLLCLQKVQTAHQRSNNALVDCLAEHLEYIVMSHMLALHGITGQASCNVQLISLVEKNLRFP